MTRESGSPSENRIALAAATLRRQHDIRSGPTAPVPVWQHLDTVREWLDAARVACREPPAEAAKAAEWLLDNEYHIRRAIRQVRFDMPVSFYRRLPGLAAPDCKRFPRIFMTASGYVENAHAQVDLSSAVAFVNAYQGDDSLRIAELWAFPAMLRLVCLQTIVLSVSELFPDLAPPFSASACAVEHADRDPTETMSRAIIALSAISRVSWRDFVEATSHVEAILRKAPDGLHATLDIETRDMYRRAVEEIATGSDFTETEVASEVLRLSTEKAGTARKEHSGWWLIDRGRSQLEKTIGFRPPTGAFLRRLMLAHPGRCYAAALASSGLLALAGPLLLLKQYNVEWPMWLASALLLVIPASIIAVTLTNWLVTLSVPPRVLPKMDLRDGLVPDYRTAVIVPVIFRHAGEVAPLMQRLERHWLSNADPEIRLALLSDFSDAPEQVMPGDDAIETALCEGIRALNRRYAEQAPFLVLHRHRRWNSAEETWMGWERKRGKIENFNEFLHSGALDPFPVAEGDLEALRKSRFVVTLDADTDMPAGSVRRLVGTLAHPLNRPQFDPTGARVVEGYTFIQPRIEISPEAGAVSMFSRLYTGDTAIDIYSRAVSDVYQDLFGEGVFTGKGGYDAAAFRQSLLDRVPENAIVSHDLFEGLHGRAALASDIVFYESFPARYPDYARRLHRWIRGDWQLIPWLRHRPPARGGRCLEQPLSGLGRWKIFDNLRRSLIQPALVLLAICGWLETPQAAPLWTLLVVAAPASYLFTNLVSGFARGRRRGAVQDRARQFRDHAGRWTLQVVFMASEALMSLDAILRTLWRMSVSRKRMLEWTSAAHVASDSSENRFVYWSEMAGGPILSLALAALLAIVAPAAFPGALPLLGLWFLSPEIAYFIGQPHKLPAEDLSETDRLFLRQLARRTWLFFETFAGPEDNWLPPDNYQTVPHEEIAHRTSPTNAGMLFLSCLTARDLGHAGLPDIAARTENALTTLDRMERHRGHILNWYDTRKLIPLEPRYVSTVDSGNLAVALVTLQEGLLEAAEGPALSVALWDGLHDALSLLRRMLTELPDAQAKPLLTELDALIAEASGHRDTPADWAQALSALRNDSLRKLSEKILPALDAAHGHDPGEIHLWLERCQHHLDSFARDLETLCPWLPLLARAPAQHRELCQDLAVLLPPDLPLNRIGQQAGSAIALLGHPDSKNAWLSDLHDAIEQGSKAQAALRDKLLACASRAGEIADAMDFRFLFDEEAQTFYIGYNLSLDRMDEHRYDLLASEARLTSYFAIAKGDVPTRHWFHLGRPLSAEGGALKVLSWNGSMFEYLMPALLIRSEPGQLLGQSEIAAVDLQRRYADRLNLPWGVSEAAFALRDSEQRYQYRAFGVPGLGMKQGLAEDYVVAPYATLLALSVNPDAALRNLHRMSGMKLLGKYGFYESVDFTPARLPEGETFMPVFAFMAHHQGMGLAAIGNALCDDVLVRRFMRNARIAAVDLILHERVPWEYVPETLPDAGSALTSKDRKPVPKLSGWTADDPDARQFHAFGNGRLSVRADDQGRGALSWHGQAITARSNDLMQPAGTAQLFLLDKQDGAIWDFGRDGNGRSETTFHAEKITYHRVLNDIAATQEITVAAADDVEIRRVTLVNQSERARKIEVTSFAEPVLAAYAAHERHPAFSKLFIHSAYLIDPDALLFKRRPHRPGDQPPVMLHRLVSEARTVKSVGYETDRRTFLQRHGDPARPASLRSDLTCSAGWTLDPVAALRASVTLEPNAHAEFAFLTIAAGSEESAREIADRYATPAALDWAFEDAARSGALVAVRTGMSQSQLQAAQAVSRFLVLPRAKPLRDPGRPLAGQPDLWSMGLSGDHPILLVKLIQPEEAVLLPIAVRAHAWWRRHGLVADLVFLSAAPSGYEAPINARLTDAMRQIGQAEGPGGSGGVHLLSADRLTSEQVEALEDLAQMVLDGDSETLAIALPPAHEDHLKPPLFVASDMPQPAEIAPVNRPTDLIFDNGTGGFSPDGRRYVIHLEPGQTTPVPWCNVLANDDFGTIVSEAGLGFTWSINSGEHRLTPWSNDPVTDRQGEALYLRDEETAEIWTPTPLPAGDDTAVRVTHGAGTSEWRRHGKGLRQSVTVLVPPEDSVKLVRLRLENPGRRTRRITATYFAEWQLGGLQSVARPKVLCGYHAAASALYARNGWVPAFRDRVAFLAASHPAHSLSCERDAFIGTGSLRMPEGLLRWNPGGRTETVRDPCGVFQVHLDLPPDAREEVVFVLGDAADVAAMEKLAAEWSSTERFAEALEETRRTWDRRLGALQVETGDPAFDLMVNSWLPYQVMSSRVLARAGFSQAGGGIGFRDQLQDMMALLISEPARVRAHILDCAAHQFEEGDVLHWWHPPAGNGVRTRCSDDLMWLVYATHRYVTATGNDAILDQEITYLTAPPLKDDEEDRYAAFPSTPWTEPLFEHCHRALRRGVATGSHGLPLMGAGDWNDGMDRVGNRGNGESIWLAWFAAACSDGFAGLCDRKERPDLAAAWRKRAVEVRRAAEETGWDGAWYMRAFDDDGEPWGSQRNEECRIDSIAQSWSVLADAPDLERATEAVQSARRQLVDRDLRLVRLLTPAFDKTHRDPGYIRAYPPGIRENGGQYTHAATWLGLAFAKLGDAGMAREIFDLINPVLRSSTAEAVGLYRGEPYVVPADVSGAPPYEGRAGWTWYTGAAAWAWRLAVEGLLGIELCNGKLRVSPCLLPDTLPRRVLIKGPQGNIELVFTQSDTRNDPTTCRASGKMQFGEQEVPFPEDGTTRKIHLRELFGSSPGDAPTT